MTVIKNYVCLNSHYSLHLGKKKHSHSMQIKDNRNLCVPCRAKMCKWWRYVKQAETVTVKFFHLNLKVSFNKNFMHQYLWMRTISRSLE